MPRFWQNILIEFFNFLIFQENVACRPRSYNKIGTLVGEEGVDKDMVNMRKNVMARVRSRGEDEASKEETD